MTDPDISFYFFTKLHSIHLGHHDVANNQIRNIFNCLFKSGFTIICLVNNIQTCKQTLYEISYF